MTPSEWESLADFFEAEMDHATIFEDYVTTAAYRIGNATRFRRVLRQYLCFLEDVHRQEVETTLATELDSLRDEVKDLQVQLAGRKGGSACLLG